jgi:hypothetical protein
MVPPHICSVRTYVLMFQIRSDNAKIMMPPHTQKLFQCSESARIRYRNLLAFQIWRNSVIILPPCNFYKFFCNEVTENYHIYDKYDTQCCDEYLEPVFLFFFLQYSGHGAGSEQNPNPLFWILNSRFWILLKLLYSEHNLAK